MSRRLVSTFLILAVAVAAMAVLCCYMGYAIGSRDDRLNRLSNENRDLKLLTATRGITPTPVTSR